MQRYRNELYDKFKPDNLDSALDNNENRTPNPLTRVYKNNVCICGGTSSGKTTFLLNCLLGGIFDVNKIFLFAPTETLTSGLWVQFLKKYNTHNQFTVFDLSKDDLPTFKDLSKLRAMYEKKMGKNAKKWLFIFDDWISLLNGELQQMIHQLLVNSSRISSDVVLLMQTLNKLPPMLSQNITVWVLFINYMSKSQYEMVLTNRSNLSLDKDQKKELIKYVKSNENKHIPLILSTTSPMDEMIQFNGFYLTFDQDIYD